MESLYTFTQNYRGYSPIILIRIDNINVYRSKSVDLYVRRSGVMGHRPQFVRYAYTESFNSEIIIQK